MARNGVGVARARKWTPVAAIALAAGVAATAGSYLAVGRRPAFVATPLDQLVLAVSPDLLVNFAITQLGTLGHTLSFLLAITLTCLLLGVTAVPGVLALRDGRVATGVALGGTLPGLLTVALTVATLSAAGAAIGAGLVVLAAGILARTGLSGHRADDGTAGRRRVLGAIGSALGLGALGLLVRGTGEEPSPSGVTVPENAREPVSDLLGRAEEQSLPVEGLEPLVSTDFYEVDINSVNPDVNREDWTLSVTGAVETEVTFDFEDLAGMDLEDRFVTLRCVGDRLNGRQMDNALWSGVPVSAVLNAAGPTGDRVVLRAADSYYNEFPLAALEPGLLAYRMNGRPLPRAHGAPVRALVPGHWGEVNVKWLTEIEVRDEDTRGYWEYRGWHGTGPVHTVAKLRQVNHLRGGRVEVAGHVYAGTRGIDAVEVSTDGGDEWVEAELSAPLPGDDVWRQWRHEFALDAEREVIARARDGAGNLQIPEQAGPKPDGATGWVSERVRPR